MTPRSLPLGFVSAILPDQSRNQVFEFAAAERFACVELMCWPAGKAERKYAGVTHLAVDDFTSTQADDLWAELAARRITLSGLGYYPNPLTPDADESRRVIAHLKKVIRAAERLGRSRASGAHEPWPPLVNTFVGRDWNRSVDDNWPRFLKIWKPLIGFAEDQGVRIGIENCPMLFSGDEWPGGKNLAMCPAIWRRMFHDLPSSHFGLNYDPSHARLLRFDHLAPLREFRHKLFHVHAKDLRFDRGQCDDWGILGLPNAYHQPRIPGFGEIDWAQFIAVLREVGYGGAICIEVEDETFGKTLAGRQRALRTARNVLEPLLPA